MNPPKNVLAFLVASVATCTLMQVAGGTPSPVLKLDFDNSFNDTSGAVPPHNGSARGTVVFSNDVPAPVEGNASIFLDATNTPGSYVVVSNPVDFVLDSGSSFTFAAWIKKEYGSMDQRVIFAKAPPDSPLVPGDASTKTPALYINAAGRLVWDVYWSGAASSSGTIPQGVWTHVAVTCDGSVIRFYINGRPSGQGNQPYTSEFGGSWPTPWEVTIGATANPYFPGGRDTGNTNGVFQGKIDEVRFWQSQLTDQEIWDVYMSTGPLITIDQHPKPRTVPPGSTVTFSVAATLYNAPVGSVLTYQWQTNRTDIVGATNATYTTPVLTTNDNGLSFRCIVRAVGALPQESSEALLTVVEPSTPPPPLAWLGFDNALNDQSGQPVRHDGTLYNPNGGAKMTNDVVSSVAGTASLLLPGDGSYVDMASPTNLSVNTGQPFTIAAWIKTTANGVIVAKSTPFWQPGGNGTHTLALYVSAAGRLVCDLYWVGAVSSPPDITVTNNQWTHVAVAYDGSRYRLYVDGTEVRTGSFAAANEGANSEGSWSFTVGNTLNAEFPKPNGVDGSFAGQIDEVAFWNASLSPAELLYVINTGIPRAGITVTQQPADARARTGATATFSVSAVAIGLPGPIRYQWQRNGVDIPGATNSAYITPPVSVADSGTKYACVISAGAASATSTPAVLTVIDTASPYAAAVLADNPLVYYRFDETSGRIAYDTSTNNFDGSYFNVGHQPGASSNLGAAAVFDGASSTVAVPALALDPYSPSYSQLTIEVWVNVTSFDNPDGFACLFNHDGWNIGALHMHVNPGNRWEFSVRGTQPVDHYVGDPVQPGLLTTNSWYHLVAVYDADAGTLLRYVNGQLVTNITYDATVPIDLSYLAHVGAWGGNSRYYNGLLDELAIYPAALTQERVMAHYQAAAIPVIGPMLNYALAGNELILSWSGPGFKLQENRDLSNSAGWVDVPTGDTSPVSVTIGPGARFFRLKKP